MTANPTLFRLLTDDRIAITGASGWLGRELLHVLGIIAPEISVLALGSKPSNVLLTSASRVEVAPWRDIDVAAWEPTVAVHLAYLTRERLDLMGSHSYASTNRKLSDRALAFYDLPSIRSVVIASSGAAVARSPDIYGQLKADDEAAFTRLGAQRDIPTVIARAWSLSGRYCTKPARFMLYDLIGQALGPSDEINIRTGNEVWRRYVDAGEYLSLCLGAAASGWTGVVDSAGALVEAATLAETVQSTLRTSKPITRPPISGVEDRYFADGHDMNSWADRLGVRISTLQQQVLTSTNAV